jgi:hypothetical protein
VCYSSISHPILSFGFSIGDSLIEEECLSPCITLPCLFSAPLPDLLATSPHSHAPPSCSGPTSHVPPGWLLNGSDSTVYLSTRRAATASPPGLDGHLRHGSRCCRRCQRSSNPVALLVRPRGPKLFQAARPMFNPTLYQTFWFV